MAPPSHRPLRSSSTRTGGSSRASRGSAVSTSSRPRAARWLGRSSMLSAASTRAGLASSCSRTPAQSSRQWPRGAPLGRASA
eukprot:8916619-Lingulodinium_polyedra.AAC.1